jgi:hypothetical protein
MVQVAVPRQIKTLCGKGLGLGSYIEEQDVTFATATTGAVAAKRLFTVTGTVSLAIIAVCDTLLTPAVAGATLEIGFSGDTAVLIALSTAADIDANDVWLAAAPAKQIVAVTDLIPPVYVSNDLHVQYTVATQAIASGAMRFYCLWDPISEDGDVAAAGVNATA